MYYMSDRYDCYADYVEDMLNTYGEPEDYDPNIDSTVDLWGIGDY